MKIYTFLSLLCFMLLGCGNDFTEYELNEQTFKIETIKEIENESGIIIPAGAKGLNYHYIPPVDPIVFAKIEIPYGTEKQIETQVDILKEMANFPENFANDRCVWWLSNTNDAILSRKTFNNGYYVELYLIEESEKLMLYIKYFTI